MRYTYSYQNDLYKSRNYCTFCILGKLSVAYCVHFPMKNASNSFSCLCWKWNHYPIKTYNSCESTEHKLHMLIFKH